MSKYRERAAALVAQMTLEEKVGQTLYNAPAVERLGIPAYNWWNEALHGVARAGTATVFPQAIGVAATFDEDLAGKMAEIIATEARAKYNAQKEAGDRDIYKGLTFWAPNVNIFRDPRWGRGQETYGEDPYLTSRMGVRFIKGLQKEQEGFMKAAACAKHFAVHSGPEKLRHSFNAEVSRQDMYETYLPAFKACVQEAGVEAVMGAYNRTNGEPCCGSRTLLLTILRQEWGFEGHVVSDCWAVKDFHENHKITKTPLESAAVAMNNGCDVNCGCMFPNLLDAVRGGYVDEERLDEAVTNLMECRMKLGMFEERGAVPFDAIGYEQVDTDENKAVNLEIARKSLVLLKNEGNLLPLDLDKVKTIGVIGPNADSRKALVGNYEGTASRYVTVLEGIEDYVSGRARVLYSEGCHLFEDRTSGLAMANDRISEVKAVCSVSDVVVAVLGLDSTIEGEEGDAGNEFASGDKLDLKFPGLQSEVLRAAFESGKPVILVSMTGSAMALNWEDSHIPAIIQAWYPGAAGGRAVAELLFGAYSPEGKLPVTFYRTTEELPEFTDYSMKNRTYRYMEKEALYPFGFGLSYTSFALRDVKLSSEKIAADGEIKVSAKIKNTGAVAGGETVQVYVKFSGAAGGTLSVPNFQLKGLRKMYLEPGEEKEAEVTLDARAFALYNEEAELVLEKGVYTVYVGTQQPDKRSAALTGGEPVCLTVSAEKTEKL
ncbi:MAG: glycoside hydrolase family 3 C-terminal domain-containing protein [Lachnospiraceae bacterium]|nr:glycoside hydrolase family 3 C-terminal domain-containing protein [Lachnospiraceae bacterium]